MEAEPYRFLPVNELTTEEDPEIVFGALSPESVRNVLVHLEKIDGPGLDAFIKEHQLQTRVLFSEQVQALQDALLPDKGLVIFAG